MSLHAVFIDVGNTLVYEKPSRFEIYAGAARRRGLEVEGAEMQRLMRRAHGELPSDLGGAYRYTDRWFERYFERIFHEYLDLPRRELPAVARELFGRFSEPDTFALFPGAIELLDRLRARGLKVGIVSNWSARLPQLMQTLGLASRVDVLMCSALERCEKPDAEIFRRALERAGVRPDQALHAGDHPLKDVAGARRVGMRSILVDHDAHRDRSWTPRVRSLTELAELVEALT